MMLSNPRARKKLTEKEALDLLAKIRQDLDTVSEEVAKAALELVNNHYWGDVRACAADFLKQANAGDFKNDEELREQFEQYVDGSSWVIYPYWAKICLACTNNADAYEDVGIELSNEGGSNIDSQRAYFAFMQDVADHPDMDEAFRIARGEDE